MAKNFDLDKAILRETRETQRFTQLSLAKDIGISREAYSRIETSGSTSKRTAAKLAKALDVSIDYLIGAERGGFLESPFFCEIAEFGGTSQAARKELFNAESELLNSLDQRIRDERPLRIGFGAKDYSDFPTAFLPEYSIEGMDCTLRIPFRADETSSSKGLIFTFRELQHQKKIGLTWRYPTRWASMIIDHSLVRTLNRYYSEYIFKGEKRGSNAKFLVILTDHVDNTHCEELILENLLHTRQFAHWFTNKLPITSLFNFNADNQIIIKLFPKDMRSPGKKLDIIRIDPDTGKEAPFPKVWQNSILTAMGINNRERENDFGDSSNNMIPALQEFNQ